MGNAAAFFEGASRGREVGRMDQPDPTNDMPIRLLKTYNSYQSNPEPLGPEQINAAAQAERVARLTTLSTRSAASLVPDVAAHAELDRLLDEMQRPGVESWNTGRTPASLELDDYTDTETEGY